MAWSENLQMDMLTAMKTAPLESDDKETPSDRYLDVCHLCVSDQALLSEFTMCCDADLFLPPYVQMLQRVVHIGLAGEKH